MKSKCLFALFHQPEDVGVSSNADVECWIAQIMLQYAGLPSTVHDAYSTVNDVCARGGRQMQGPRVQERQLSVKQKREAMVARYRGGGGEGGAGAAAPGDPAVAAAV